MRNHSAAGGFLALLLALALCLSLAGCSGAQTQGRDTVPVQSVSMLLGMDITGANRYCGVAEPKSKEQVKKDANKDIGEIKVTVGQEVRKGDVLFTYDLESVRLSVESARLEVEQLQNSITAYNQQLSELEKDKRSASKGEKLSYSLQIQETQLDKAEAEYNLKKKQAELTKLEKSAKKTQVKAEVDGMIQTISQSGLSGGDSEDSGGGDDTVLTIVETGAYCVKGSANETNIARLQEGMDVVVYSRTDYTQQWTGVITEIDTGSAESGDSDDTPYQSDGEEGGSESSARYSFYVQLDSSDGMMMGQHVYVLPGGFQQGTGIQLNSSFLELEGEQAFVWAAGSKDTLERRAVTLGAYDEASDSYQITDGLSVEDYIAVPASGLTEGRKVVKYDAESLAESDSSAPAEGGQDAAGSAFGEMDFEGEQSALGEAFPADNGDAGPEGLEFEGFASAAEAVG